MLIVDVDPPSSCGSSIWILRYVVSFLFPRTRVLKFALVEFSVWLTRLVRSLPDHDIVYLGDRRAVTYDPEPWHSKSMSCIKFLDSGHGLVRCVPCIDICVILFQCYGVEMENRSGRMNGGDAWRQRRLSASSHGNSTARSLGKWRWRNAWNRLRKSRGWRAWLWCARPQSVYLLVVRTCWMPGWCELTTWYYSHLRHDSEFQAISFFVL